MIHKKVRDIFRMPFDSQQRVAFMEKMFFHNNAAILLFASFLAIEQLFYGVFVTSPHSSNGRIHLVTAFLMVIFAVISYMIRKNPPKHITWILKCYVLSFGALGFYIAIMRSLTKTHSFFSIPTVYIAVIYGFAVIFYFTPKTTFGVYFVSSGVFLYLMPIYQPEVVKISYIQDIIANNIIAWLASVLNFYRYVHIFKSQLEVQKANKRLHYLSSIDVLTKVYNRRKLEEILHDFHKEALRHHKPYSLILMDIDHFKAINDTYGHSKGDEVLFHLATLISRHLRKQDVIGRWGGEEFLIICPETNMEEAGNVAEKIRCLIAKHSFKISRPITGSFGVSTYVTGDTVQQLIHRADQGMYQAKETGRNNVKKFA